MARRENQKTKLLVLLNLLTRESDEEHPLSVPQLLLRLEENGIPAERKSIYSDIQQLQELGYSIEIKRGPKGGYYLVEGLFQRTELKLLVDAVQSSRFVNEKDSRALIKKLTTLTSRYHAQELNRQVRLAGRKKTPKRTQYALNALHEAVNSNRQVSFIYQEWTVEKELVPRRPDPYVCSPAALTYSDGQYYLVATKAGENRLKNFRVDRMKDVTVLEAKAVGCSKQDVDSYVEKMSNMFGGEERDVTLSAPNTMANTIIDKFGTDPIFLRDGADRFHFTVSTVVSPQFFGWVCGLGGKVRIEAPEDLRAEFRRYLEKLSESL